MNRLVLFLIFFIQSLCLNFYDTEIQSIQSELKLLTKARELLQSKESSDLLTLLPYTDPSYSLSKFVPKSLITNDSPVGSFQFITLKPMPGILHPSNIGLLIGYMNGIVELREITGNLLFKLQTPFKISYIACTNSFDDIKFAFLSEKSIEIYNIIIEKLVKPVVIENFGIQTTKVFVNFVKETEVNVGELGTSLMFYVKGGKKSWVVGDEKGNLVFFDFNGKKESFSFLNIGAVESLDRVGPQIVVSSNLTIGILNVNTLELQQLCPFGGKNAIFDANNVASIVYAVSNEDVAVFDTRVVENDKFVCKSKE